MAEVVSKQPKQTSSQGSIAPKEVLTFEERIIRLRLEKSKERSFLLSDKPSK
jgi:hypothetical protein